MTRQPRDGNRRTPRQALEHFRATGQHEEAEVLARLLDGPRREPATDRRRAQFTPEVVDFLQAQDRRRDAARRLPAICPFSDHEHALGCFDPVAASG